MLRRNVPLFSLLRSLWDQTSVSPSFSAPFDISTGKKLEAHDPDLNTGANPEGVRRLMPNLESLDIHLYNTTAVRSVVLEEQPYQHFLTSLFHDLALSSLKSLTLRHMTTTAGTLATIFSQHPRLLSLTLDNIYLPTSSGVKS